MVKKEAKIKATEISIPKVEIATMNLAIENIEGSSLICNRFSEDQKQQIEDKQQGKAKIKNKIKDPQRCYEQSLYMINENTYGFPASGFKKAAVEAATFVGGKSVITMKEIKGSMYVFGTIKTNSDLVEIIGTPNMRDDIVRIGGSRGGADIHYRGEFKSWKAVLRIRYNSRRMTIDQIVNLFNNAGFSVGVGDWRPQTNGNHGMFRVKQG